MLLCPSENAASLLASEGITVGVHIVGDVMTDVVRDTVSSIPQTRRDIPSSEYFAATLHRAENATPGRLSHEGLAVLAAVPGPVILPMRPRTLQAISDQGLSLPSNVTSIDPLSHSDMLTLFADGVAVGPVLRF
jgi:UDP-N-acetylglucosamine 2-epimerase